MTKNLQFIVGAVTVLTAIAVLACNVFPDYFTNTKEFAKWGLGAVLVEIIALFVLLVKNSAKEKKIRINLSYTEEFKAVYTINKANWNEQQCFARVGDVTEKIEPVPSQTGAAFTVQLPDKIINKIEESSTITLELADLKGNQWRAGPFFFYERTIPLEIVTSMSIQEKYD